MRGLGIKSAVVFCLPGIWTADIQMFSFMHKSQICLERSLYFSETIPLLLTCEMI